MKKYIDKSILEIDKEIAQHVKEVIIDGDSLTIPQINSVATDNIHVTFTDDKGKLDRIKICYEKMIQDVKDGLPIYGCNTGYGAQASHVLVNGTPAQRMYWARKISEGITHIDVTTGPLFSPDIIRGAMLIRINMLMKGVSAIKIEDLTIYQKMLNANITPLVNQYGGIGASGDLAHNCRVLNAARQMPGVKVWDKNGKVTDAKKALQKQKISQLILDPKAGLGFVNGDNFSTSLATLLASHTLDALLISCVTGAMTVEVLRGTNRSFHPLLWKVRQHKGQEEVAKLYAYLLDGSKLAYQEMEGHKRRPQGVKVQDAYSLRGISQYHGVNFEKIKIILDTITINANSASDNPLWVSDEFTTDKEPAWQWVSGGNFLAMHMVDAMDTLRKIMTQIVKLNDRHLARMINPNESNGLPPNLSDKKALTNCAFKGVQIQSGMYEVYSTLLSIPVSTFFGVHEENNQDITSHALTSGILGLENLRITRYSLAQNLVALAQAVDLSGGSNKLSPHTKPAYDFVREKIKYVKAERPLNNDIEIIYETILNGDLMKILRTQCFNEFA